jgi:hypothetical protein
MPSCVLFLTRKGRRRAAFFRIEAKVAHLLSRGSQSSSPRTFGAEKSRSKRLSAASDAPETVAFSAYVRRLPCCLFLLYGCQRFV